MKNTIAKWIKEWAEMKSYPFLFYQQTSSTNDRAKEYAFSQGASPHRLFIAEFQTKGRGQGHKTWMNSDMMLSWSFAFQKAPQPKTTKLMGEALYSALKCIWQKGDFKIKQPNDIYIGDKKLAGLLVEAIHQGPLHELIVGAGMNVQTHPEGMPYTHLQEHIRKASITKNQWFLFLDEWLKQIKYQLPLCT